MKFTRTRALIFVTVLAASPLVSAPAAAQSDGSSSPQADELSRRVQDLEKQLAQVQQELAAMKSAPAAQAAAPAPSATAAAGQAPTASNSLVTSGSAAPTTSAPTSLGSLLGSTTFSAFVDTYYGYNFNNPPSRTTSLRSFETQSDQFALNLIELIADKTPDPNNSRMGYHVALGFGSAMNAVNATDPGGLGFAQYLKEAYFSYLAPVGKGLQIDVGKFVTPAGAEVIESKDNWNYSRGLLFSYAIPYYHFGGRAKYTFNDKYSLTGFLTNGWNNIVDNNTGKTYGMSFGWTPTKKWGVTENYMAGPEENNTNGNWRHLTDTVVTYTPNDRLSLMLNYDYGRGDRITGIANTVYWTGIAGYVRYAWNANYAFASRYEYYNDHYGFTTGTPEHVNEFTETLQRIVAHHLITRLEFRRDFSNRPVFPTTGSPVLAQNTVTAGLVYAWDSKEAK